MYVDAIYEKENDRIRVVERVDGERVFKDYPAKYVFYYPSKMGEHVSIFGDRCDQYVTYSKEEFDDEVKKYPKVFEKDVDPLFRCLEENYLLTNSPNPKLNIAFFDLEVRFSPERGFAPSSDPFNEINAASVYLKWLDALICLAVIPPNMTREEAQEQVDKEITQGNVFLFDTEEELLVNFLEVIEDADILSGWNSEGFDIPYIVGRIERVLGKKETKRLCLWDYEPKKRKFVKFKKEQITYDLIGRIHIDYLALFLKHSMGEYHSYRLDYIGEKEVGEKKVPYDGTLEQLYHEDFGKFVAYSLQDSMLLNKIDEKKKYIDLANNVAHTNGVVIPTTQGSVVLIDQAIINEAHSMGFVVPSRKKKDFSKNSDENESASQDAVAGAYVVDPKRGMHDWVGSVDINSLYPSVIRSLNMAPESLVGQLRPTYTDEYIETHEDKWGSLFASIEYTKVMEKSDDKIIVDFEDGSEIKASGSEIYDMIFGTDEWNLSANGTIFRNNPQAVIPHILTRWYNERKTMQAKAKFYEKLDKGIELDKDLADELEKIL